MEAEIESERETETAKRLREDETARQRAVKINFGNESGQDESAEDRRLTLRGELALLVVLVINSLGVVLMLRSGSGISAISSVPYAFEEVFPFMSLGTWTYLFQGLLVVALFLMRRRFVPSYLLSFVVGFLFGEAMDLHELWVERLPQTIPLQVLYFAAGYVLIVVGIALSNRCRMPIIPTDLFPREASGLLKIPYSRFKIGFDVTCLAVTALMTWLCLGEVRGLGIGTVLAAFTMGKAVGVFGNWLDQRVRFVSLFQKERSAKRKTKNRMTGRVA